MIPHIRYIETLVAMKKTLPQIKLELEELNLTYPSQHMAHIIQTIHSSNRDYFISDAAAPDPA
jgi:hypothetical protein